MDDYDIKNKLAFEVAHTGYQNQKENFCLLPLQQQQQQQQQQISSIKQVKMKRLNLKLLMKKKTCHWFLLKHKKEKLFTTQKI